MASSFSRRRLLRGTGAVALAIAAFVRTTRPARAVNFVPSNPNDIYPDLQALLNQPSDDVIVLPSGNLRMTSGSLTSPVGWKKRLVAGRSTTTVTMGSSPGNGPNRFVTFRSALCSVEGLTINMNSCFGSAAINTDSNAPGFSARDLHIYNGTSAIGLVSGTHDSQIRNCIFAYMQDHGVASTESDNLAVTDNTMHHIGKSAIQLWRGNRVNIRGNDLTASPSAYGGVRLAEGCVDAIVEQNVINGFLNGIYVIGLIRGLISRNSVNDTLARPIWVTAGEPDPPNCVCQDVIVSGNMVWGGGNGSVGIHLERRGNGVTAMNGVTVLGNSVRGFNNLAAAYRDDSGAHPGDIPMWWTGQSTCFIDPTSNKAHAVPFS